MKWLFLFVCVPAFAASPWETLCSWDLDVIHQTLSENHPGVVDPQNPNFRRTLEVGYTTASEKLETVTSLESCYSVLKEYTNSFDDGHLKLNPTWINKKECRAKAAKAPSPPYQLRAFKKGIWLSLPYFDPNEAERKTLEQILRQLPSKRNVKFVVFDLRGNGGGDSAWGDKILDRLYGFENPGSGAFAEWRVSKNNLKRANDLLAMLKKDHGENSDFYREVLQTKQNLEQAEKDSKPFARQGSETPSTPSTAKTKPLLSKAIPIALTDEKCFSSCLNFMDSVLQLPNVIHVGQTTGKDTVYMEINWITLPSGLADLNYPMKVYRGRKRGHNVSYVPSRVFEGDLSDTKAVEAWLIRQRIL